MNGQHKDIDIVIYGDGFRPNVGIVICNQFGQVLWARRIGQNSWQFPPWGIKSGESPVQAMYRELNEELGLLKADVKIMMISKMWHKYQLPQRLVRWNENPVCLGQRQKWFLLKLSNDAEKKIQFNLSNAPEFDNWRWVSYWYPVRQVISFKRDVYRKVLKEFSHCALFDFGKSSDSFKSSNSRGTVKKNNKNFYQLGIRR